VVSGHSDGLVAAALSADEALLASASYDKTVRVVRGKSLVGEKCTKQA
jgi:hypothetical protein